MSVLAENRMQQWEEQPVIRPETEPRLTGSVVSLQTVSVAFPRGSLLFGILAAFGLCFLILFRYGVIAEMNYDLGRKTAELTSLKEAGRMLEVEIESGLQLDMIRQIAEENLGMHEPATNQVVPVNVPKSAYSVVSDLSYVRTAEQGGGTLWTRLAQIMGAMFR